MKKWTLPLATILLSANLYGTAQEKILPPKELPPAIETPPAVESPSPGCSAPCEKVTTTYKLHWLERDITIPTRTLKDVTNKETRQTVELDWVEEKRIRTEVVLKPREIVKEVTICTTQPVEEIDPVTGCKCIVLKPVTETKMVKEIVFDCVTQDQTIIVRHPYLKPVDKNYTVKSLYLECGSVPGKERYGILVRGTATERVVTPAIIPPPPVKPPCDAPICPAK